MAVALNANLLVVHATEKEFDPEKNDTETGIENKLHTLKKELTERTNNKIKVHSKQVWDMIENELMKLCEHKNPLAVVMATHGASLKEQFFIGSITVYLSKNLKYPVIVVPAGTSYKPINKILLATDLEDLYSMPVEKIISIVTAFNAEVDIVHVYKSEDKFEVMSARISELMNRLKNIKSQFYFIKSKNVYEAILEFARTNNSDLILTFPKKHAFFYRSESKQLIFKSPLTVMTIH
jgi:nucleotide-binding universal stress UspA family protein